MPRLIEVCDMKLSLMMLCCVLQHTNEWVCSFASPQQHLSDENMGLYAPV